MMACWRLQVTDEHGRIRRARVLDVAQAAVAAVGPQVAAEDMGTGTGHGMHAWAGYGNDLPPRCLCAHTKDVVRGPKTLRMQRQTVESRIIPVASLAASKSVWPAGVFEPILSYARESLTSMLCHCQQTPRLLLHSCPASKPVRVVCWCSIAHELTVSYLRVKNSQPCCASAGKLHNRSLRPRAQLHCEVSRRRPLVCELGHHDRAAGLQVGGEG